MRENAFAENAAMAGEVTVTGSRRRWLRRGLCVLSNTFQRCLLPLTFVALCHGTAQASETTKTVRIGVLSDFSSVYSTSGGSGLLAGVKLAIEDFNKENPHSGLKIEVVSADHQNKADIGGTIARQWFDRDNVDVVMDVTNSAVAFTVSNIARRANKVVIFSGAGSARLTGDLCSPNTVHWTYDTYEVGNAMGRAITQSGGKSWFFINADYAFGQELRKYAEAAVTRFGGTVVGGVSVPSNNPDFSSYLLQAQGSGAKVVAFALGGNDLVTAIKQAQEFGMSGQQTFAALNANIVDVRGIGLDVAQGILVAEPFYWDMNPVTRAWTKRFIAINPASYPTLHHAAMYAATLHYLRAVAALGDPADGRAVVAKMEQVPTHDGLFSDGMIRKDGRTIHDIYLFRVKSPSESKGPWDYYKLVSTIPGKDAFRPLNEGECPLVK
ncbi:ABC transporter substrate-binding protein [Paraburkholderia sp. J12]|uniref:ABC transporter substrate-binding protein n=1 Tax=Paraburkholderia sp. J12 TaxID=2805432 RepID=UPI002ABDD297|nr:ABC transporter substrate-binding protein [Paraburkholderia sp. J12]